MAAHATPRDESALVLRWVVWPLLARALLLGALAAVLLALAQLVR